jgi:hypothetical protein
MEDLFGALGYERFRLNIHKSGREIDLEADHRTESRHLVAECKATGTPIGGDELNKFYGSLDVEKRKLKSGREMSAYFVSLSGFTQTAIEQEKDAGNLRFVRLDGGEVAQELIRGRILVPEARAIELATRGSIGEDPSLLSSPSAELLAHELGWIWVIYFGKCKDRTHFALIHADGEALSTRLAGQVVESDKSVGGPLSSLLYLSPPNDPSKGHEKVEEAEQLYLAYIKRECGEIQLEGLPADQDVGSRRMKLENIFVPLHLVTPTADDRPRRFEQAGAATTKRKRITPTSTKAAKKRQSVGKALAKFGRLAVLGLPGGGKSTLLKRIAIAYAFPERRRLIHDDLPNRKWLPLFLRCRQLEGSVREPITEILRALRKRAEIDADLTDAFSNLIGTALHSGEALLLVDGLDEISDHGDRVAFVKQLRTFLATYPAVAIVITCREAGFRIIGGALAGHCSPFKLADLNDSEIKDLTVAWHKEVVGSKPEVESEAQKLADAICKTDRVRRLAQNPLLLTTLLLVKRWVGQLPTKRSVLYGKAVEVLLMTWNVEGHEPIDPEEALPQLEFAAFSMMKEGSQRISVRRLGEILAQSRAQMPEVLGYTKIGVQDFIERVELRSSLLMLSGFDVEGGTLYPMYEFRHLTFQEYLAARAIVTGHYPGRLDSDTVLKILMPHLQDQNWEEVVLLSAVLAGRNAQPLIEILIEQTKGSPAFRQDRRADEMSAPTLLAKCIIDEVQVPPDLLREAMRCVARRNEHEQLPASIFGSKYGGLFEEVCLAEIQIADSDLLEVGGALSEITLDKLGWPMQVEAVREKVTNLLSDSDPLRVHAAV